jgi:hypothetical protein
MATGIDPASRKQARSHQMVRQINNALAIGWVILAIDVDASNIGFI